jgi:Protein of unknown function (DUF3995)
MVHVVGLITTTILLALSLLHIYWALGGDWGSMAAVPSINGQPLFANGLWDTLSVALALTIAAIICLGTLNYRLPFVPTWVYQTGIWCIALVFLLRAIGEFRYLGFFKQVNDSMFAHWDTIFYTPLCLGLAICCIILAVNASSLWTSSN